MKLFGANRALIHLCVFVVGHKTRNNEKKIFLPTTRPYIFVPSVWASRTTAGSAAGRRNVALSARLM